MKNLHLISMCTHIDVEIVESLNSFFPHEENLFISKLPLDQLSGTDNYLVDSGAFNVEYINQHCSEYRCIIIHSMFLSEDEIIHLSDEAADKIVWVVWGQDLYNNGKKPRITVPYLAHEAVHCVKKFLRGTYYRSFIKKRQVSNKVSKFRCVGIGYLYDEKQIRKRFGKAVKVQYLPVSGIVYIEKKLKKREDHLNTKREVKNVLIGHSGYHFLEHEKYLRKLSAYKDKPIHIHMVLCYGADENRIRYLKELAYSIFGAEKCTIVTELVPVTEYMDYLSKMDVAIFPFRHQSALGNTISMAFMGVKLYFDPRGVLSKGFKKCGVTTYDCRKIGKIPFEDFIENTEIADVNSPLFDLFYTEKNKQAWAAVLQ